MEQKDVAAAKLRDLMFKDFEMGEALKLPGSTEEDKKAHSDVQKMIEHFKATILRRNAEIKALEEEDKALDDSLEALKTRI